mmetsp:Transcript_33600/g.56519  ORF Transcript_33600/g.56519 Transcript_33600/m.56519 type:complete len:353 (+) Transcript_33600:163-1221(+)
MVFILPNGDVVPDNDPRANAAVANARFYDTVKKNKLLFWLAFVTLFLVFFWKPDDPFADGPVPAAARPPTEHWGAIQRNHNFVRLFTDHANGAGSRRGSVKTVLLGSASGIKKYAYSKEYGGDDGHEPEAISHEDLNTVAVTRCTSTRFAVTAYFCGLDVASNRDQSRRESGNSTALEFEGAAALDEHLVYMHRDLQAVMYRLGIGSATPSDPPQSHVWSIVGHPDGTFHWLQSFVGHYSLQEWMTHVEKIGEKNLSLAQLRAKLRQVQELQAVEAWTERANALYLELFHVDQSKAAQARGGGGRHEWVAEEHGLVHLTWDMACVYPLPLVGPPAAGEEDGGVQEGGVKEGL